MSKKWRKITHAPIAAKAALEEGIVPGNYMPSNSRILFDLIHLNYIYL